MGENHVVETSNIFEVNSKNEPNSKNKYIFMFFNHNFKHLTAV